MKYQEQFWITHDSFYLSVQSSIFLECHVTQDKLNNEFNISLRQYNEETHVWLTKKKLKDGSAVSANPQFYGKWF